jgi:hypothetical protein
VRKLIRNGLIKFLSSLKTPPWQESDVPLYRTITYHRIEPDQQLAFKNQLRRLKKEYHFVTPEEFADRVGTEKNLNLLLTFDDGYLEWETIVLKTLRQLELKAIFFVSPDFIGLSEEKASAYCRNNLQVSPARPLTAEGLRKLREEGHTVGNHLLQHTDLRDQTSAEALKEIFKKSQDELESQIDFRTDWVAYPFGDYFKNKDQVRNLAENFFEHGFTLRPGYNSVDTDPLMLHRDGFSPDFSAALERAWFKGGFDPIFELTHLFN